MAFVSRARVYQEGGHILNPGDGVAVKFVTTVGYDGDFAVYMGLTSQTDQEVADHGDKVPENVARAVAPYCAHLYYRN